MAFLMGFLLVMTALFMILLVLVQRGRGGGLAGAFGGMGGQSAFGTKAGDLFTRITIGVAAFWILLCIAAIKFIPHGDEDKLGAGRAKPSVEAIDKGIPAGRTPAKDDGKKDPASSGDAPKDDPTATPTKEPAATTPTDPPKDLPPSDAKPSEDDKK